MLGGCFDKVGAEYGKARWPHVTVCQLNFLIFTPLQIKKNGLKRLNTDGYTVRTRS